jgi:hypothetical protein
VTAAVKRRYGQQRPRSQIFLLTRVTRIFERAQFVILASGNGITCAVIANVKTEVFGFVLLDTTYGCIVVMNLTQLQSLGVDERSAARCGLARRAPFAE